MHLLSQSRSAPSSRGSVIVPVRAVAAAVAGLHRYTASLSEPERPESCG
jgi:hypothetical protein